MKDDAAPPDAPERLVDAMRAVRPTRPDGVERSHGLSRLLGAITESAPTPTKVDRFVIEDKLGEGGDVSRIA